ncbi:hypothetical protein ACSL103130_01080 [Actinomyces slackii]|uniref:PQQ enzyme repeat n=1 Tax=Actinomyces slackii TaxID=52774 RepID=A0A3S5EM40_9ACTO|nr:hypothetical protein [Actinomyces slackii]VEG74062.1 Uncharacterised protein [Actinomyces slackii]
MASLIIITALALVSLTPWLSMIRFSELSEYKYESTKVSDLGGQDEAKEAELSEPRTGGNGSPSWIVTAKSDYSTDDDEEMDLVPTAHGPLVILNEPRWDKPRSLRGPDGTILASLDPKTGAVRWFRTVRPVVDIPRSNESVRGASEDWQKPDAISVSADGEYVALRLETQPSLSLDDSDSPRWNADHPPKQTILVLSTKTGEVVRTVETHGVVLGQALTNNDLLVQTSSTYRPEGGEITTYSLSSPKASGNSWRSTNWLVGATARGALLSTAPSKAFCNSAICVLATVTVHNPATGTVQQTYDRVMGIFPAGGLLRLPDGQALPAAEDDAAWDAAPREFIDVHSGARIDVSNLLIGTEVAPTGQAWLFHDSDAGDRKAPPPSSWLLVGDHSATPRTEDLDVVTLTLEEQSTEEAHKKGFKDSTVHIERTTLTMGSGG